MSIKNLNLGDKLEEPMRFKRVVSYLSYVVFVFYMVAAIYHLKVAPAFLGFFETSNSPMPGYIVWYYDYWFYLILAVSILLCLALVVGNKIKKIFKFENELERSFIFKFMIFKGIKNSYLKVNEILNFPVLNASGESDSKLSDTVAHLMDIDHSSMELSVEMNELLKIEMRALLDKSERQMTFISILVAFSVIAGIYCFLASAYSPIFMMGNAI